MKRMTDAGWIVDVIGKALDKAGVKKGPAFSETEALAAFGNQIRTARDFSIKHPDTIVVLDPRKLPRKKKKSIKPS